MCFTYFCYILANAQDNTYNGFTTNLQRRIRQHNGELVGGARSTSGKGPWAFALYMSSPEWTMRDALRMEWNIRYPTGKHERRPWYFQGALGRALSLRAPIEKLQPQGLTIWVASSEVKELLEDVFADMDIKIEMMS